MSNFPHLHIFCGLPGSGKSTLSKEPQYSDFIRLSSDDYIENVAKTLGKTYNEVFPFTIRDADRDFRQKLDYCANSSENIIIDRTNLTIKVRKKLLTKFKNHQKTIIFFDIPLCIIKERNNRPGKIFSDELLDEMFNKLQKPTEFEARVVTVK